MKSKSRKDAFFTQSGLEVAALYSPKAEDRATAMRLGAPGEFPYTRGIHQTMYRGKLWTMRQYSGFGSAGDTNSRFKELLAQGTTGLSVAFDLPTQMGRDPDHPLAQGEVGRTGVSIASVEDMKLLFNEIPLQEVSVSMTINATALTILAFYLVAAEESQVKWSDLRGTVQNDVLKEYIARGTYIYPPAGALTLATEIFRFCGVKVPKWNTISVSGYHIREAGSTAVQELAFTLSNAIAYLKAAKESGLNAEAVAQRIAFFFNCHNNFLEEIAKFRAARRLWAKLTKQLFAFTNPQAMMMRFHTQTAGSTLTAQQPYNNIVRTTIQALAAVIGGTQSLHTNGFDEALSLPTAESATLALRTQQIIGYESGVADSVDPLAGSYLIENWTDRIEREAEQLIEQIESAGGMLKAIEKGFPQGEIERSAFDTQRRIEQGEEVIVGVNQFTEQDSQEINLSTIRSGIEAEQRTRVAEIRKQRDSKRVQETLNRLTAAAKSGVEIAEAIIEAARARGTLGEISDALRGVYGEHAR